MSQSSPAVQLWANAGVWGASVSNYGVVGTSAQQSGVFGYSDNGLGVSGQGLWAGVFGYSDYGFGVKAWSSYGQGINAGSEHWYGVYGHSLNSTGVIGSAGQSNRPAPALSGPDLPAGWDQDAGVFGTSEPLPGVTGASTNRAGIAAYSVNDHGVKAQSDTSSGVRGTAGSGLGLPAGYDQNAGVFGTSQAHPGVTGTSQTHPGVVGYSIDNYGVYGESPTGAGYFKGDVTVTGMLMVQGAKPAAVPFPDGSRRLLYCIESPVCWFEDFGSARLERGRAVVKLDSDFAKVVKLNECRIFLTPEGDCRGLYVRRKGGRRFEVRELQKGTSSIRFSYRIVARRKDVPGERFAKVQPALPMLARSARGGRRARTTRKLGRQMTRHQTRGPARSAGKRPLDALIADLRGQATGYPARGRARTARKPPFPDALIAELRRQAARRPTRARRRGEKRG